MKSSCLDGRLSSTQVSRATRQAIIDGIFRVNPKSPKAQARGQGQPLDHLDPYFDDWYEEQCDAAYGHVDVQTHQQLLDIVELLQEDRDRPDILAAVSAKHSNTELLNATIDLAARIWLTISIGYLQHAFVPGSMIAWNDGKLSDTIQTAFQPKSQFSDSVKLPKNFTARNLERIAGIEVAWTSNLADHLSLKDEDTKIMIYHQSSFLEIHKSSGNSAIPPGLIDETLFTLALLIPSTDKASQSWFKKKQKEIHLNPKAGTYGPLNAATRQTKHFHYWRDRLEILKQTFDESEPHTISLWWNDDRKKVQWYTFWIAALVLLLTVFFGLVTSISGIVQAWAAVRVLPSS